MKRLLWILPLLLLLASCNNYRASRGPADWIYVSETGNDGTGDGTSGAPYATVSFACTQATAGDTVYVMPGTITETAQVVVPVNVSIYGAGATSIIKSTVTGTNYTHNTLSLSSAEGTNGSQSISYIKMDGDSETGFGAIYIAGRSNVIIHHCTIVDFYDNGVIFNGAASAGEPTVHATGNEFYNCHVENSSGKPSSSRHWSLGYNGQDGFKAYENTLLQKSRTAGTDGCGIKSVSGFSKNCKIYDNYIECNEADAAGWGFGIEVWNQDDLEIYGNTIKGIVDLAGGGGVGINHNISVHNNTIGWDNLTTEDSYGIIIEAETIHSGVDIYKNIIKNVNTGIIFYPTTYNETYEDINIYDNLLYNIGKNEEGWTDSWGITGYTGGRTGWTLNRLKIYNNLIIGINGTSYQSGGIGLWNEVNSTFKNIDIVNNIIMGFEIACILDRYAGPMDSVRISNNISYNNEYSNNTRFDITPTHYTAVDHIKQDPLFKSTSDFHLQSTSPAINAGINVSLTSDFAGHRVPQQDTVDIGAYEYGDYLVRTPSGKLLRNANGKFMITH